MVVAEAVKLETATPTFRFRPLGPGRFFMAAFLAFWLCGWLAGEVFALSLLWRFLSTFLSTGQGALPAALFLLVWVSFWSVGGAAALHHLLRAIWSEDRLSVAADGSLERRVQLGPFRHRRALPRGGILRFQVRDGGLGGPLVAELPGRSLEITRLGSLQQRQEAAEQLNRLLGLSPADPGDQPSAPAVLPAGWQELTPSFGSPLLVPDLAQRRRHRLVMGLINLVLWGLLALLVRGGGSGPGFWAMGIPLALVVLACGWAQVWLTYGRREWRLEPRLLVLQRRFGHGLRTLGEGRALELIELVDSDGDRSYRLQATRTPGNPLRIAHHSSDPSTLRQLGAWLAARSHVPFEDRVPTEAQRREQRTAELERLRQQLVASGRLGRWAAKQLDKTVATGAGRVKQRPEN
ncbi:MULTISPECIES: hypothetical protein [unclassified Cyanobium]|uniref:hypothetical protein n=1 Tax=unclassified Cyanobium TaxID=2627006 RepID=UPI0020CBABCE|nr:MULTISPECIES: hypothetical protein [unclassified Cyanobium]MCP9833442.1 hypothetical protein [Cyanobium sp. La Preciosa 7G6]MCP9936207.1 hypothetical protein [Cyanobium sp. Aljojuca 7A6]